MQFQGTYSESERKLFGIKDLLGVNHLEEDDILLFTYCGDGRFEVEIFDNTKVEKCLMTDTDITGMSHVCTHLNYMYKLYSL